jgi:hypothetical protein
MKIKAAQAKKLREELEKSITDKRKARGIRHAPASVLAIAIGAVISGNQSLIAIGEWANRYTLNRLTR